MSNPSSEIGDHHNNESSHESAPPEAAKPVTKPKMYRSKYADAVAKMYRSNKHSHRTMGYDSKKPPSVVKTLLEKKIKDKSRVSCKAILFN